MNKINQQNYKTIKVILIYILTSLLIIGLVCSFVCFYNIISNNIKLNSYSKTEGKLIECRYEDGSDACPITYKYIINGKTYEYSPTSEDDLSDLKSKITIYCNPNKPEECIINKNFEHLLIWGILGIIIVIIVSIIFYKLNSILKRVYKQK